MDHDAILSRLCGLGAPSGFEGPASRAAAELLRPLADEVTVDRMGSVLALRRCGRGGGEAAAAGRPSGRDRLCGHRP